MAPKRVRGTASRGTRRKAGKAKKTRVRESIGLRSLRTLTNLAFYAKLPKESKDANTWLSKLWQYGVLAFKLAVALFAVQEDGSAISAPTGTVQAIAITPDTLVFSSPVTSWRSFSNTDKEGKVSVYHSQSFGYRQVKVHTVHVRITPGSVLKERAGRISAVIIPLTWAESVKIQQGSLSDYESYQFLDIVKMPGAVTSEANRPVSLNWTPRQHEWGSEWLRVGQQETPSVGEIPPGGLAIAVLLVGYQDLASPKPDVDKMYSADEALYNADVRASVSCREYGDSWLRPVHRTLLDPDKVAVSVVGAHGSWDAPSSAFRVTDGKLVMAKEYVTDNVTRALTNQTSYRVPLGEPADQALNSPASPSSILGFLKL